MQRAWGDDKTGETGAAAQERESSAVLRATSGERVADEPGAGFRAILERVPDAIIVHRGGVVVYANPAAATLLGYAREEELAGVAYRDLVHPDQEAPRSENAARPLARCEAPATAPLVLKRRDGSGRSVESMALPLDDGGEREWMLVARAAERPALDPDLRAQHVAALSTLAAGVSHEINNPMTYLLVHLEHVTRRLRALVAGASPSGAFEEDISVETMSGFIDQLAQALDGARRVQKTVRHLMTFAQGASEGRTIVDARAVMESALQMAWHQIRPRARVVKQLGEVPPVDANEARLAQAFAALLTTAAGAIPEGSAAQHRITVSTGIDAAGRVVVTVSDTGEGLQPHQLARVFDPYFGAHAQGDGLALAVAHGTVQSLGGQIECQSAPGAGTTFRVTLPAAAGWAPRARAEARRRVVVIDDDPQVGQALALALSSECEVLTLSSGQPVLDRLAAGERFDAIICDLTMPPPSGIDLYAQALRIAPDAVGRIVFTTSGAFTPRARAFLGSVRNVCLDKPVDEKELRTLLRRWGTG